MAIVDRIKIDQLEVFFIAALRCLSLHHIAMVVTQVKCVIEMYVQGGSNMTGTICV